MAQPKDMEAIFRAARPRMAKGGVSTSTAPVVPLPPHTHAAKDITYEPGGLLVSENVQDALEEHDTEKLARDGSQVMLGDLDLDHHDLKNAVDVDIEGDLTFEGAATLAKVQNVREINFKTDAVGEAKVNDLREVNFKADATGEATVNAVRAVHFTGDLDDGEALADGLEKVAFNDEPTKSVIEKPSRIEFNAGVTASADYTAQEGTASWDDRERALVAWVTSGAALALVALGWGVSIAVNGNNPV